MNVIAASMVRAGMALQLAALEWDEDQSVTQDEARQALVGMQEAINQANFHFARMKRLTEQKRHGKAT